MRLVGGRNPYEGRVEVCVLETWRTICSQNWGMEETSVVCRQLGYSRYSKGYKPASQNGGCNIAKDLGLHAFDSTDHNDQIISPLAKSVST